VTDPHPADKVQLEESWKAILRDEFASDHFKRLAEFLREEKKAGKVIYPPGNLIFNAFNTTPFGQVKVVVIGQDPYHGPGQAHGLSFSVPDGVTVPPSLQNIFKELAESTGFRIPNHGNLTSWAKQGVLLLNATLTVRAREAGSHQRKGWEEFTDAAIRALNERKDHLVFMLWGRYAQDKGAFIDRERHLVLMAPHPSPFSVHKGFFGSRHFAKANEYLKRNGKGEVDWAL
jgi:uracil-DNA glycosylase